MKELVVNKLYTLNFPGNVNHGKIYKCTSFDKYGYHGLEMNSDLLPKFMGFPEQVEQYWTEYKEEVVLIPRNRIDLIFDDI